LIGDNVCAIKAGNSAFCNSIAALHYLHEINALEGHVASVKLPDVRGVPRRKADSPKITGLHSKTRVFEPLRFSARTLPVST
jgi:hypothetical protein